MKLSATRGPGSGLFSFSMNTLSTHRVALLAVTALVLAACEASQTNDGAIDPQAAQQMLAARADPDKALAEKVKHALGEDVGPGAYGVEVTAADGKVQLWGRVESNAVRQRIGVTAAGVVGVKGLENKLQVDPGA